MMILVFNTRSTFIIRQTGPFRGMVYFGRKPMRAAVNLGTLVEPRALDLLPFGRHNLAALCSVCSLLRLRPAPRITLVIFLLPLRNMSSSQ